MNNFEAVKGKLKNYNKLKADITSIELDIRELNLESNIGMPGFGITEKTGRTYKFNSDTENEALTISDKVKKLENEKAAKEIELQRINNALSVLSDKEKEVVTIIYINGFAWSAAEFKLDKTYQQCKNIEYDALRKMEPYLIKKVA